MPAGHKRRDDCTQTQTERHRPTEQSWRHGDGDEDVAGDQDKSSAGSPVAWLSLLLLTVFVVVAAAFFIYLFIFFGRRFIMHVQHGGNPVCNPCG